MTNRCNAYGAENPGGHAIAFGGFLGNPVSVQPYCANQADHRFRWVCEHGHHGTVVALCKQHYLEFTGDASAFPNMRRNVQACPRCASQAPECDNPEHKAFYAGRPGECGCRQHKCSVRLVGVS